MLTLCERRTLSKNLTLSYDSVIYQIKTKRPAYTMRGAHVAVRENSYGEITIEYKQRPLADTIYRRAGTATRKGCRGEVAAAGGRARGSQAEAKT